MAVNKLINPLPKYQFFDLNGDPLVAGLVYTYVTGSSTPLDTYADAEAVGTNTNPIVLDSRGEATIWWQPGSLYRVILKTAAGVQIWSEDNIGFHTLTLETLTVTGTTTLTTTSNYPEWLSFNAVSQTQVLTTGQGKFSQVMPAAGTVVSVVGALVTASSSGVVTFDIHKNGTTILGNKLVIDEDETSTLTASTPPTIATAAFSAGDVFTIDYDTVGTDSAGSQIMIKVKWT